MTRARRWTPAGRITYYDDELKKIIGLEGVKVKARRWFTTHTGYPDADTGNYRCDGTFKREANYSFDFERYEFQIKGNGVRTEYNGPKQQGDWGYHFSRSNSQTEYAGATVFRAAYHYYYKDIGGLRRPPLNSFMKSQMKLKVYNQEDDSSNGNHNPARRFLGLGSQIKICNPHRNTYDLYATTIHELAHAAHWRMVVKEAGTNRVKDYHNAEDKMCESWASGVQWYLTKMVYPTYLGRNYDSSIPAYSNIVIDLVDKEYDINNGKYEYQGDKVTGYTMSQIETALIGCDTWNKWRNKIKTYNNETKNNVDALFDAW